MSDRNRRSRSSPLRGPWPLGRRSPPPPGDPRRGGGARAATLWFGVLAGPTAWLAAFLLNVLLIRGACGSAAVATRWASVGIAGLVAIVAGLVAFGAFRRVRRGRGTDGGAVGDRDRFMAIGGMGWNAISLVLVIALVATFVVLDPCVQGLGGPRL